MSSTASQSHLLPDQLEAEVNGLLLEGRSFELSLNAIQAIVLIGALHDSLREPFKNGPGPFLARRMIEELVEKLGHPVAITELIRCGFNSDFHASSRP